MDFKQILQQLEKIPTEKLTRQARAVLAETKGKHVHVRGLLEFSNICARNCLYCGLRRQNRNIRRYRLSHKAIMDAAANAVQAGAGTIVLQSGEGAAKAAWLADVVKSIKSDLGVPVTLSVGECAPQDYELWRKAGADRFLLKHETADPLLYSWLHPGYKLSDRLQSLRVLSSLGYEIGSGFMTGLPGQSLCTIARDIELCMELDCGMCGVGPFIPHQDTPLASWPAGSPDLTLRVMAALRIAMPHANLPATTALATLDPEKGQTAGLMAGGNVLMPSFTPAGEAASFTIYDNKNRVNLDSVRAAVEKAGREHSLRPGA